MVCVQSGLLVLSFDHLFSGLQLQPTDVIIMFLSCRKMRALSQLSEHTDSDALFEISCFFALPGTEYSKTILRRGTADRRKEVFLPTTRIAEEAWSTPAPDGCRYRGRRRCLSPGSCHTTSQTPGSGLVRYGQRRVAPAVLEIGFGGGSWAASPIERRSWLFQAFGQHSPISPERSRRSARGRRRCCECVPTCRNFPLRRTARSRALAVIDSTASRRTRASLVRGPSTAAERQWSGVAMNTASTDRSAAPACLSVGREPAGLDLFGGRFEPLESTRRHRRLNVCEPGVWCGSSYPAWADHSLTRGRLKRPGGGCVRQHPTRLCCRNSVD